MKKSLNQHKAVIDQNYKFKSFSLLLVAGILLLTACSAPKVNDNLAAKTLPKNFDVTSKKLLTAEQLLFRCKQPLILRMKN